MKSITVPHVTGSRQVTEEEFERADSFTLLPLYERGKYLGNTDENKRVTMNSFDRPADNFWHGFILAMARKGYTDNQISTVLSSKHTRWMLDDMGDLLQDFGFWMANKYMSTGSNKKSIDELVAE